MRRPVVLIILDGWGVAPPSRRNAITSARTPVFDSLVRQYVSATIQAAGEAVGLPWGEQGNSEVGHTNIGAGRIVYQDLQNVNRSILDGSFFENPAFLKAVEHVKRNTSALHMLGLFSNGGVHSSLDHLFALVDLVQKYQLPQVWIHGILDGRDVSYNSGMNFVREVERYIANHPNIILASLIGRFFAMDRDRHWDRIEQAYRLVADAKGAVCQSLLLQVEEQYRQGIFDEYMPALVSRGYGGVAPNDALIFFNFRADRARQLTRVFTLPGFSEFPITITFPMVVTMTRYEQGLPVEVAFPESHIAHSLCEVISETGVRQFHIAETEKYAHVTYFLSGGREEPFRGQENVLVPSLPVSSYDEVPEMRAREITSRLLEEFQKGEYDFYAVNFANADMVGHTGNFDATVQAVETLDGCLKDISEAVLAEDGILIITSDHGNAEELIKAQSGEIDKEHSDTPVPFILVGKEFLRSQELEEEKPDFSRLVPSGVLADVAPTVLKIMGVEKPKEMTGRSLV